MSSVKTVETSVNGTLVGVIVPLRLAQDETCLISNVTITATAGITILSSPAKTMNSAAVTINRYTYSPSTCVIFAFSCTQVGDITISYTGSSGTVQALKVTLVNDANPPDVAQRGVSFAQTISGTLSLEQTPTTTGYSPSGAQESAGVITARTNTIRDYLAAQNFGGPVANIANGLYTIEPGVLLVRTMNHLKGSGAARSILRCKTGYTTGTVLIESHDYAAHISAGHKWSVESGGATGLPLLNELKDFGLHGGYDTEVSIEYSQGVSDHLTGIRLTGSGHQLEDLRIHGIQGKAIYYEEGGNARAGAPLFDAGEKTVFSHLKISNCLSGIVFGAGADAMLDSCEIFNMRDYGLDLRAHGAAVTYGNHCYGGSVGIRLGYVAYSTMDQGDNNAVGIIVSGAGSEVITPIGKRCYQVGLEVEATATITSPSIELQEAPYPVARYSGTGNANKQAYDPAYSPPWIEADAVSHYSQNPTTTPGDMGRNCGIRIRQAAAGTVVHGGKILGYPAANYTTGTVTIASGVITLTGGTWPNWAGTGVIKHNGTWYEVASRTSGSVITLTNTGITDGTPRSFILKNGNVATDGGLAQVFGIGMEIRASRCKVRDLYIANCNTGLVLNYAYMNDCDIDVYLSNCINGVLIDYYVEPSSEGAGSTRPANYLGVNNIIRVHYDNVTNPIVDRTDALSFTTNEGDKSNKFIAVQSGVNGFGYFVISGDTPTRTFNPTTVTLENLGHVVATHIKDQNVYEPGRNPYLYT